MSAEVFLLEAADQLTATDQPYARAEQVEREPALLLSKGIDIAYPQLLAATYGDSPVSGHVFLRVRWQKGGHGHAGH